jgi:phosphatidylglycerophosphate synthase
MARMQKPRRERTWTLATIVTASRIAVLPLLWWWALDRRVELLGIGVMASFLGDILDGQLARRMNQVTRRGAQLDSVADASLLLSSAIWLLMFRPEILQQPYAAATTVGMGTWLLEMGVGLVRHGRFLNLHLYSGKASGALGTLFVTDALILGFHAPLFYLAFGTFTLGNLEGLAVMLTRSHLDEHIGSILRPQGAGGGAAMEGVRAAN